jgi:L-cysteine:1D-myo-inositol 2-amino-2-deoxy-alpha-D-glucopyranoside ligase
MHVAMVFKDGEKMSKSLGNLVFVDQLRTQWDPRSIRMAVIEHHYRNEWEWDEELMPRNHNRLVAWMSSAGKKQSDVLELVRQHLDNDLDTPSAIAAIDAAVLAGEDAGAAAALLGVDIGAPMSTSAPV